MNPKVDFFFTKASAWQAEYQKLRSILNSCGLEEELKWGCPCYTYQQKNIVLIHGFKDYCALLIMNGALLNDSEGILIQQTENVQAARQIRFTALEQIEALEKTIKAYVFESIELEKAGVKVQLKKPSEFKMADEFAVKLAENKALKLAFETLTPGRQRAYLLYFSAAKQSKTREARVEKSIPQILAGKGIDD